MLAAAQLVVAVLQFMNEHWWSGGITAVQAVAFTLMVFTAHREQKKREAATDNTKGQP